MQLCKDWLKGEKNFFVGRALYNVYGDDAEVKRILSCGYSENSFQLLELS